MFLISLVWATIGSAATSPECSDFDRSSNAPGTGVKVPCFPAGTAVSTPDGDRAIEEIEIGDTVHAYDLDTGTVVERKVVDVFRSETGHLVDLKIRGNVISATRLHQFWVENEREWIPAFALKPGDTVRLASGELEQIESMEIYEWAGRTFNLEVEANHNYFVGKHHILVHNGDDTIYRWINPIHIREDGTIRPEALQGRDNSVFRKSSGTTPYDIHGEMARPGQGGKLVGINESDLRAAGIEVENNTRGTDKMARRMQSGHGELRGTGANGKVTGGQSRKAMANAFCP